MQTTVNLPDSLYQKSEALAVAKEVEGNRETVERGSQGDQRVDLQVIRSRRPGTLDLSRFDFDDLLA
jgi:hypothetical protein